LAARQAAAVALAPVGPLYVLTDQRLLTTDGGALPLDEGTKSHRLVKLEDGETVVAALVNSLA
jgi:hypothetical protein